MSETAAQFENAIAELNKEFGFLGTPTERFERLRTRYEGGDVRALIDALQFHGELQAINKSVVFPHWMRSACIDSVRLRLESPKKTAASGPKSNELQVLQSNIKKLMRFLVVHRFYQSGQSLEKACEQAQPTLSKLSLTVETGGLKTNYYAVGKVLISGADVSIRAAYPTARYRLSDSSGQTFI